MRLLILTGAVQLADRAQFVLAGHFTIATWLIPASGVLALPKMT